MLSKRIPQSATFGCYVLGLLFWGRPTAIFRFIVAVRIWPTVKSFAKRFLAHVCQKVLEFTPSWTDFDSTLSISVPFRVARIGAALNHICPTMMSRSLCLTVSFTRVNAKASTTTSSMLYEHKTTNHCSVTARTAAKPIRPRFVHVAESKYSQATEGFP